MAASRPDPSMRHALNRFQAGAGEAPRRLTGGAGSLDALSERFIAALERADVGALESLRVTRAEFAHLYFPESPFMRAPYELDPNVVWLQIDVASRTGLHRAIDAYGGRPFGGATLRCRPPDTYPGARIHGCDLERILAPGDTVSERLFGAILEVRGRFKFLSLQNRL